MDSIKAIKGLSPYMGSIEHLSIYLNDQRLDEYISSKIEMEKGKASYLGLIPAWLDFYDNDFSPSVKEKEYVWEQTKLNNGTKVLPILLCPDDFDFSCSVIVVEVIDNNDTVIWNRFGADITPFNADEIDLPKYIGIEVKWFPGTGPFHFLKDEYLKCIEAFSSL